MSLATLAAAAAEVTLGGQVYRMSPLRIKDQAEFERWVQERVAAMDPQGEPLTVARRVLAIGFYSQESLQAQRSVEGIARLVWLGVRRNHAGVGFEQISDAATLEELGAAYRVFNRINYAEDAAEVKGGPKLKGPGAAPAPAPEKMEPQGPAEMTSGPA